MKRFLAASAALASVAALAAPAYAIPTAAPAPAAPKPVTFNLDGNVPATCNLSAMAGVGAQSAASGGISVGVGGLNDMIDANGKLVATAQNIPIGANWCNGAATTVTVSATPLTNTAAAPNSGFTNRVDYTVTGSFPGVLGTGAGLDTATASSEGPTKVGAFSDASDTLHVVLDSNTTQLLVAGTYLGAITVTVTPG